MIKFFINSLGKFFMNKRLNKINFFMQNPIEVQKKLLLKLINNANNVFFGKKYRFKEIKNYEDFINRVPIHKYEDIFPFIQRMLKGEKDILWPGKVKWFAKSSGTTNDKSKYIPITKDCLYKCHYQGGKDLIAYYINNNPNTKIFFEKNFHLGGSYKINNNIFIGDISSIIINNLPFWANYYSTPKKELVLIDNWDLKIKFITNNILKKNIISLLGIPSWMLIFLTNILKVSKKNFIDELWPDIEVFFHGGVNFSPYIKQYKNIFKKKINYYNIYNASEGFFAFQDKNKSQDLLLLLNNGIFYEFIPFEEINNEHPNIIPIEKVNLNKNYAMVISTNSGLWRYIIGDTIKFTSLLPYRIVISGRTKQYINILGEELIVDNVEYALKKTCEITNSIINEYTVGPIYMTINSLGYHEWIIEFHKKPNDIKYFLFLLDKNIQSVNSDYKYKRTNALLLPKLIVARKNLFYDWLKIYKKLGGQNKIPRLCNDRRYLDFLIKINN